MADLRFWSNFNLSWWCPKVIIHSNNKETSILANIKKSINTFCGFLSYISYSKLSYSILKFTHFTVFLILLICQNVCCLETCTDTNEASCPVSAFYLILRRKQSNFLLVRSIGFNTLLKLRRGHVAVFTNKL